MKIYKAELSYYPFGVLNSDYSSNPAKYLSVDEFEISTQITLGDYKVFLLDMKNQEADEAYQKLLPEKSIGTTAQYQEYLSNPDYEKYPVVGVSWESAMKYCLWKTLAESENEQIDHYYLLPENYEWLQANNIIRNLKKKYKRGFDWDEPYSTWLLRGYFTSSFFDIIKRENINRSDDFSSPYRHFAGNSFLLQIENEYSYEYFENYYFLLNKTKGYRHLGFRLVKHRLNERMSVQDLMTYWEQYKL